MTNSEDRILRELQIANLLKTIEITQNANVKDQKARKILTYVFDRELTNLQFDVALFPREEIRTQDYKFHEVR